MKNLFFLFYLLIGFLCLAQGQKTDSTKTDSTKSRYVSFYNEKEDPFKQFEKKTEPKDFKKKKPKRKVYYGYKTRRGYTKVGYGLSETREVFHFLKVPQNPSIYAKEIYWFDTQKLKIMKTTPERVDKDFGKILHGPYKKLVGGQVVEKGIYYVGTKHGRWEKYKKPTVKEVKDTIKVEEKLLISKEKYWKGFPKESEITYYDEEKTKIKEVKPFVNGDLHGDYFYFYPNGLPKIQGKYMYNQKVGAWTEYFETENLSIKHKQFQYPKDPFVEQFEPYLSKEWDRHRHLIYDKDKQGDKEEPEVEEKEESEEGENYH